MKEINKLIKKAKLGQASQEVQIYLSNWFQAECDALWKDFVNIKIAGKTDKQLLCEFLDLRSQALIVNRLQEHLVRSQCEGQEADHEIVNVLNEIKKDDNNPQY